MATPQLPRLPNKHSIRVISLAQHDSPGAPLEASIKVIDLDEDERAEYVCLSYTWGAPTPAGRPPYSISINGAAHSIRENLKNALHRLRNRIGSQPVWIDALSISQNDLTEKAQQVGMIARIFSSATEVLVWLGEHADGSDQILTDEDNDSSSTEIVTRQDGRHDLLPLAEQPMLNNAESDAWVKLFERDYWTRTWIVQEVVVAKSLTVLCGHTAALWETLHDQACFLTGGRRKEPSTNPEWRVRQLNYFRKCRRDGSPSLSFKDVISTVVSTSCADRRGRLYAILSLDDEWQLGDHIQPDYTIPARELFAKLVRTIGMFDNDEAILLGSSLYPALQMTPTELEYAMQPFLTMPADNYSLDANVDSHDEEAGAK